MNSIEALAGFGVLPLQYRPGETRESLGLTGEEVFSLPGLAGELKPGQELELLVRDAAGVERRLAVLLRLDTPVELHYFRHGGILQAVLRGMLGRS